MQHPDDFFDPQEAIEEACWDEFCDRIRAEPWVWIAESISEADYDSDAFKGMVNNLIEELPNVHPDNRDAHLGRCLRELVNKYSMPKEDWAADKLAEIAADAQDRADYESDRYEEMRFEDKLEQAKWVAQEIREKPHG